MLLMQGAWVQSQVGNYDLTEPQSCGKTFIMKNLTFHTFFFKTYENTDKLTGYTFTYKLFFLIKIILKE